MSYAILNKGVNLLGLQGSVTCDPGEAAYSHNCLPAVDGGFHKHWGWERMNATALVGTPLACKGFTYRGKNVDAAGGNTARPGNFGLADDGAVFTRRQDLYSTFIVLTATNFYFWNPATETFDTVALPGGVAIDENPVPTIVVVQDNAYIVGWTDFNLRYDPTDRVLYRWGWAARPGVLTGAFGAVTGDFLKGNYGFSYSYVDIYTGEETQDSPGRTFVNLESPASVALTIPAYAGARKFNTLALVTDSDVGVAIWRTKPIRQTGLALEGAARFFLTLLNPGTLTFTDAGLGTDKSVRASRSTMQDEPRFNVLSEKDGRFYGISWSTNTSRVFFSDFDQSPFYERFKVGAFKELSVPEGEILTALPSIGTRQLASTQKGAYMMQISERAKGSPSIIATRLPWSTGIVGPRAAAEKGGFLYFLSEKGPQRWRLGTPDPEWIGKNVSPMFFDPNSKLCLLSEEARMKSKVVYHENARMVRFAFALGGETDLTMQLGYWIDSPNPMQGWWPQETSVQDMDTSHSLAPLESNGEPVSAVDRAERLVTVDSFGFVNEYGIGRKRGGLLESEVATGLVSGGTRLSLTGLVGLYTTGDGLTSLWLELEHPDGTSEVRRVGSNTGTVITPSVPFETVPTAGQRWWVGGFPAFWRSWPDHMGFISHRKTVTHLFIGYRDSGSRDVPGSHAAPELAVSISAGEFAQNLAVALTTTLKDFAEKFPVSRTARFFQYEVASSRPDEHFAVTYLEPVFRPLREKRLE